MFHVKQRFIGGNQDSEGELFHVERYPAISQLRSQHNASVCGLLDFERSGGGIPGLRLRGVVSDSLEIHGAARCSTWNNMANHAIPKLLGLGHVKHSAAGKLALNVPRGTSIWRDPPMAANQGKFLRK